MTFVIARADLHLHFDHHVIIQQCTQAAKIVYIILSFMNKFILYGNTVIVINFHFYQKFCFSFNEMYTMNKYVTIRCFEALVKR